MRALKRGRILIGVRMQRSLNIINKGSRERLASQSKATAGKVSGSAEPAVGSGREEGSGTTPGGGVCGLREEGGE
jgi:hypothetical protein